MTKVIVGRVTRHEHQLKTSEFICEALGLEIFVLKCQSFDYDNDRPGSSYLITDC